MRKAVILVGHGGLPTDFPREALTRLRTLEAQRRKSGGQPTGEERELDATLRHWPRTPQNDPYQAGLEALAARIRRRLEGTLFAVAYNEFCAPTLEDAAADLIAQGATAITIVPSMLTPGGSHSEIEIPETLARLQRRHAGIVFRYAWPFDLDRVADLLAEQVQASAAEARP